jgi:hypothetical protein
MTSILIDLTTDDIDLTTDDIDLTTDDIDLTTDDIDSYLSQIRKSISYMYMYIVHILDSCLFNLLRIRTCFLLFGTIHIFNYLCITSLQ